MAIAGVHRHPIQGRIVRNVKRPRTATVEGFCETYTAFVLDHLGKHGAMSVNVKPLSPGMRVCGPAITSLGPDLSVRRMAINLATSGDVLVVAAGGIREYSCFGDGTARRMMLKGIQGAVIDGSTRDARWIRELGFPTFARDVTPRNYHYPEAPEYGAVNVPVICAGALVCPGDLVIGDDDGVVVVPREIADELLSEVQSNLRTERAERAGMRSFVPFEVEAELRSRGYRFE